MGISEAGRKIASFRSGRELQQLLGCGGIVAPPPVFHGKVSLLCPAQVLSGVKGKPTQGQGGGIDKGKEDNRKPLGYFPLQRSRCLLELRRRRVMGWPRFREELCAQRCSLEGQEMWFFGRACFCLQLIPGRCP